MDPRDTARQYEGIARQLTELAGEASETARQLRRRKNGDVSPGPGRWQRAALNAVKQPNSAGAKLYLDRAATARQITAAMAAAGDDVRSPWQIQELGYKRVDVTCDEGHPHSRIERPLQRRRTACSAYCMLMLLQLETGVTGLDNVREALQRKVVIYTAGGAVDTEFPLVAPLEKLKRPVTCGMCGTKVKT